MKPQPRKKDPRKSSENGDKFCKNKSTERSRNWREKQRSDSKKHKHIKQKDRFRKQKERKEKRDRMLKDPKLLEEYRLAKRLEMRKYRQKKADQQVATEIFSNLQVRGKKKKQKTHRKDTQMRYRQKVKETANKKRENVRRVQQWRLRVKLKQTHEKAKTNENKLSDTIIENERDNGHEVDYDIEGGEARTESELSKWKKKKY